MSNNSEKKVVSLKQHVPVCTHKDMKWEDRVEFTDAERDEMFETGRFVCWACKTLTHNAVGGKVWNVHYGRWIQE